MDLLFEIIVSSHNHGSLSSKDEIFMSLIVTHLIKFSLYTVKLCGLRLKFIIIQ